MVILLPPTMRAENGISIASLYTTFAHVDDLLYIHVEHKCVSDAAGTATQTKGGGSATFALNDSTYRD